MELILFTIVIIVARLMLKILITDLILIMIFDLVATKMLNVNIFQIFKNPDVSTGMNNYFNLDYVTFY